jgi:hypothetical protein
MELSLSLNSRRWARFASGLAALIEGGKPSPKVNTLSGRKPGSTSHSAPKVRIIRPAPINRTKASATSTATP